MSENAVPFTEAQFERIKFAVYHRLPLGVIDRKLEAAADHDWLDFISDSITLRFTAAVYGRDTGTLRLPATWWDWCKARWFPAWALRRWPVQYAAWVATALYPDAKVPDAMGPARIVWRDTPCS